MREPDREVAEARLTLIDEVGCPVGCDGLVSAAHPDLAPVVHRDLAGPGHLAAVLGPVAPRVFPRRGFG